jgi:hypothetical protein
MFCQLKKSCVTAQREWVISSGKLALVFVKNTPKGKAHCANEQEQFSTQHLATVGI